MKKKKAFSQLCVHVVMWNCIAFVQVAYQMIRSGSSRVQFPKTELIKLISFEQLLIYLLAGFLAFAIVALFQHKSLKLEEQKRAHHFNGLILDEMGSILFSFGAFLLVLCLFVEPSLLTLATSLSCFLAGMKLKPWDENNNQQTLKK